ncbi:phosphodiester glycosidase family protein [Lacrimispora indolis]|uniref:phosphodiester glycosidase family protein n=1 Tax=Lacrimispora indolis TaxID=69825 RepID=UPI0004063A88|nr:phosphodiester glycosidase family protein [[Clostridium] methoxybenzovorans]
MNKKRFIKYILIDFLSALLLIFIFLLYFYILPRKEDNTGRNMVSKESAEKQTFELPESQDQTSPKKGRSRRESGNTDTKSIASENSSLVFTDKADTVLAEYKNNGLQLNIVKSELGEGNDKITYYTADIYLSSTGQLKTAFAQGVFGKNLRESTLQMAEDNNAMLAISGDSYGNNETGIVIRNGILYRSDTNDAEICILFLDGTMKIYTPEEFDQEQIMESDVWQAWNFGPSLLNQGNVRDSFQTTSYLNNRNPRCAIGYVSPGHYKFVLVDGRNPGYSKGATMSELAQIMAYENCTHAYNLDGGKSSAMVYQGNYINQPADGGRSISDIIYIRKEASIQ